MLLAQARPPSPQKSVPITTIGAATLAQILPPPTDYRFPDGQSYVYSVEWHMFTAGTATVKLNAIGDEQRVTATADSAGVVSALFRVHDLFQASFDPHSFCSLKVSRHIEEGSRQRNLDLHLDYTRRKSVLDEKNLKTGELKHTENDIPGCVTDVISGFYYLASLPLQQGSGSTFAINDGRTTEVTARVESREQIKVPAGTFQTVRVRVEAVSGSLKGKGEIWVWFTEDANHTPVQMRSKLGWGTLLFRLQRIDKQ
ncbi:MAG TPA: DUF3108 domain-containing protein [Terriglobales bacterium]|nr:DUF3108 domain-containing protein [Terriglobales bacterium]